MMVVREKSVGGDMKGLLVKWKSNREMNQMRNGRSMWVEKGSIVYSDYT